MDNDKKIEDLTVEEIEALIRELGDIAYLTRELNAKQLMRALPGMKRKLALILVSTQNDTRGATEDPIAKALYQLLIRHQPTAGDITTMLGFCLDSEHGSKCFRRAVGYYYADPTVKGRAAVTDSLLLQGLEQQVKAEAEGTEYSDEQAEQDFNAEAKRLEQLRLREWLSDEYDINSPQDFAWMMDALRCVWKANKERWLKGSRAELDQLTRKARRLYERAKTYPCSPSRLVEWDEQKRKGLQPHTVYKRPNGDHIWGDGSLVIWDKDGNPRRPQTTIFGKAMGEGTVPMDFEMQGLVEKAWGTEE